MLRSLRHKRARRTEAGFSLIEILITIAIFLILAGGIYFSYANILEVIGRTRMRTLATSLLNKEIEYIRNLKYDDVGIAGGYPVGLIPASKNVTYEGQQFVVSAFVRNIDDAFDGKTGSTPNDTAPADYRLVELQVACPTCFNFVPVSMTTWAAPQNLESSTQNGSLFIQAFDASGRAVSGANVLVKNTAVSPTITITDTTGNDGYLRLVDIPTSTTAYQVTVSKAGYSTGTTYAPGGSANPNPTQPHATVASQQVSSVSFAIDKLSQINVFAHDQYCQGVPATFTQSGAKLVGVGPDVSKYATTSFTTSQSDGTIERKGLEWDIYTINASDTLRVSAGVLPSMPLSIDPGTTTTVSFLMEDKTTSTLLVSAFDGGGIPLDGVSLSLTKTGFTANATTGEKVFVVTDWSGSNYDSQDGTIESEEFVGQLRLETPETGYATGTNSYLISNTLDMGTSSVTFASLNWSPVTQDAGASLSLQLASSDSESGPFTFVGPNGTETSFYTATGTIHASISGKRYVRYKVLMNTTNTNNTPKLNDLSMTFFSGCVPGYQATWHNLPSGTYTLTASKSGYQTATSSVLMSSTGWQHAIISLP